MQTIKSSRENKIKYQKIQELWSSFNVQFLDTLGDLGYYWVLGLSFFRVSFWFNFIYFLLQEW